MTFTIILIIIGVILAIDVLTDDTSKHNHRNQW